jgi:hypothetical protein
MMADDVSSIHVLLNTKYRHDFEAQQELKPKIQGMTASCAIETAPNISESRPLQSVMVIQRMQYRLQSSCFLYRSLAQLFLEFVHPQSFQALYVFRFSMEWDRWTGYLLC